MRELTSERLSFEQSSPSPAPTGEVPNESLPDSTSAQPSEVPFEQQHGPSPRPSPRPSPTPTIPDSIPRTICKDSEEIFEGSEEPTKVRAERAKDSVLERERLKYSLQEDSTEVSSKPTSPRSLLTLKPLPKIDPKDKGKKKIEEEDESESEDDEFLKL
ncbi:hypothetical protein Tco_0431015 [Tanacetum coccineum]